jgi:hypothetical protein
LDNRPGKAVYVYSGGSGNYLYDTTTSIHAGRRYLVTMTTSSGVAPVLANVAVNADNAYPTLVGNTATYDFVSGRNGGIALWLNGGTQEITNITVKEIFTAFYGEDKIINGDFSNGFVGWTLNTRYGASGSVDASGVATYTSSIDSNLLVAQQINTKPGAVYEVVGNLINGGSGGVLGFYIGASPGGTEIAGLGSITSNPLAKVTFTATGSTAWISAMTGGASQTVVFDNIMTREVTPIVAYPLTVAQIIKRHRNKLW